MYLIKALKHPNFPGLDHISHSFSKIVIPPDMHAQASTDLFQNFYNRVVRRPMEQITSH